MREETREAVREKRESLEILAESDLPIAEKAQTLLDTLNEE